MIDATSIIRMRESQGAIGAFDETLDLPDLTMFFFAMTDLSKVLTGSKKPDFDNPKLWQSWNAP